MLLALDIGNTNIVIGCFDGDQLKFERRLKTDAGRTVDEYSALLLTLLERELGPEYVFQSSVISSVVPPITGDIVRMVQQYFGVEPILVGPGVKSGIEVRADDPRAVGSDRVVNSLAARELYGAPALVIDFGTATSFDVVGRDGAYEGGVIAPGAAISLEALVRNTAKLPRIEMTWPKQYVGKNTIQAMQSGAVVGYASLVEGLVQRLTEEMGGFDYVVATGGNGKLFAEHIKAITVYEPHLTLQGLRLIAEMNT